MSMRRTSLHLDDKDLKALERIARAETTSTGSHVSASAIVRRLIREFLVSRAGAGRRAARRGPHSGTA